MKNTCCQEKNTYMDDKWKLSQRQNIYLQYMSMSVKPLLLWQILTDMISFKSNQIKFISHKYIDILQWIPDNKAYSLGNF